MTARVRFPKRKNLIFHHGVEIGPWGTYPIELFTGRGGEVVGA
jgi:hypothetical protein